MPGTSFEVWRTEQDVELKRQWIWIRACDAPGPALLTWVPLAAPPSGQGKALPLSAVAAPSASSPLVRSGDAVVVLESGKVISMRLSGRAMEAGARGARVRVRITAVPNGAIVSGIVLGQDEISLNDPPEGGSSD